MKIIKVEAIPLIFPYEEAIYDASFIASHRQTVLVKVTTDNGLTGWGEAASFGGPPVSTCTIIEKEVAPRLIGENPLFMEKIWKMLYHRSYQHARGGIVICAISGIDIALWDIASQHAGMPLHQMLGGYRTKIKAYASGGFYKKGQTAQILAQEVRHYAEKGYRAIKVKVGRNHSNMNPLHLMPDPEISWTLEEDLERVQAAKNAIGNEIQLLVDANAAWDIKTAMRMGREFEKMGVYAFEEPLTPDEREASNLLRNNLDIRIAGYESEQRLYGFKELINGGCIDMIQPDLTWGGGITECRKIAAYAEAYNISCSPHCFSSAVSLAAALQFNCSVPNAEFLELDQNPNGLRTELIKTPFQIDAEGFVHVPDKNGLGIEINEEAIEKYRVE